MPLHGWGLFAGGPHQQLHSSHQKMQRHCLCYASNAIASAMYNYIASARYNYIAPPAIVSVRFRQGLSPLKTTFDSKTDRMGLDLSTVFNCELVLNTAGLGASSKCMGQSEFDLIVSFGTDPTVVPGDFFILRASALKSLDEMSPFAAEHPIKAEILAPTLHALLGPITIRAIWKLTRASRILCYHLLYCRLDRSVSHGIAILTSALIGFFKVRRAQMFSCIQMN